MFRFFKKKPPETPPEPSPVQLRLEMATREGRSVRLRYKQEKEYRSFDPYIVYLTNKGVLQVRGKQTKDPSSPFTPQSIVTFDVADISAVALNGEMFKPDPGFSSHTAEFRFGVNAAVDRQ